MLEPIAYIKDREVAYLLGLKQKGATHWITNLGFEKEEGDIGLYTEEQVRQLMGKHEWKRDLRDMCGNE